MRGKQKGWILEYRVPVHGVQFRAAKLQKGTLQRLFIHKYHPAATHHGNDWWKCFLKEGTNLEIDKFNLNSGCNGT